MNNIIKSNLINARDIWTQSGNKKKFSDWMFEVISKYNLVRDKDFFHFTKKVKREIGATVLKEYYLTKESAKLVLENEEQSLVNARDIWENSGSKRQFGNWINYQIEKYDLKEDRDFLTKNVKSGNFGLGVSLKQYLLTKESARLILEDKAHNGLELRKKHDIVVDNFMDKMRENPIEFLEGLVDILKQKDKDKQQLNLLLKDNNKHFTATQVGQEVGLSAISLNNLLKNKGFIYCQSGTWIAKACIKDKNYITTKECLTENNQTYYHSYFTAQGRLWILENIENWR